MCLYEQTLSEMNSIAQLTQLTPQSIFRKNNRAEAKEQIHITLRKTSNLKIIISFEYRWDINSSKNSVINPFNIGISSG